jgi:hypothetical protein
MTSWTRITALVACTVLRLATASAFDFVRISRNDDASRHAQKFEPFEDKYSSHSVVRAIQRRQVMLRFLWHCSVTVIAELSRALLAKSYKFAVTEHTRLQERSAGRWSPCSQSNLAAGNLDEVANTTVTIVTSASELVLAINRGDSRIEIREHISFVGYGSDEKQAQVLEVTGAEVLTIQVRAWRCQASPRGAVHDVL